MNYYEFKINLINNITDDVTKQFMSDDHHQSRSNLAWLVTPALFALGLCYLVYKCCKDGLCNCRRLRERAGIFGLMYIL